MLPTPDDEYRRHSRNDYRRAPQYTRIAIIPGILYLNLSRSGISVSFGQAGVGRASVSQRGVRLNKSIGGFNIGKTFSFSSLAKLAKLFGGKSQSGR